MPKDLVKKIKKAEQSVIAIGFKQDSDRISIVGSGFAVNDNGKIVSAAHIYNQAGSKDTSNPMGMVLVEKDVSGLEFFRWTPLKLIKKDDKNDIVIFEMEKHADTLLKKIELGNSENIEVGKDVYFIGFPYAAQLINDGFGITRIVNKGIISNIKRDGIDPAHKKNFFVIDAISNPGNSGCPLISIEDNKVIGIMVISFRIKSQAVNNLDIREPMHICAAKPINLVKSLLESP